MKKFFIHIIILVASIYVLSLFGIYLFESGWQGLILFGILSVSIRSLSEFLVKKKEGKKNY